MMADPTSSVTSFDTFSQALRPPPAETEIQRRSRLQREHEAILNSEKIDEQLRLDRERLRKLKNAVKLLLLGQAESGKSTLLKQFQLMYKPKSLDDERLSWRTVIFFNVIRSIKYILATLDAWDDTFEDRVSSDSAVSERFPSVSSLRAPCLSSIPPQPQTPTKDSSGYQIANLRRRLSPVIAADPQLAHRLTDGITVSGSGKDRVFVRSGWQARSTENGLTLKRHLKSSGQGGEPQKEDLLLEDVGKMLEVSKKDIQELWQHPTVRAMIAKRKMRLAEWDEFFLDDINRIASSSYFPTTDDILHARIQTMGVVEHSFDVQVNGKIVPWHLYDVGGARGQRHTWIPYFEDATAILFVAPVSAFDQFLDEDPRTNRINDSLQLFTHIVSSPLLRHAHLVLFLNKIDILQAKLSAGSKVSKYITSYGDRPNEFENVVQYFRTHFENAHSKNNPKKRVLYTHLTSVINTKTTHRIIENVRDSLLRELLKNAALV